MADMDLDQHAAGYAMTPLIEGLLQDVQPQLETSAPQELSAQILDQMSDHESDAPEGLVPNLSGRTLFNVGKYQKAGQAVNFATAYLQDKPYVAWVRKFIKSGSSTSGKTNHPTMSQFRLYVALRDQKKSARIAEDTGPIVTTLGASPKAKAKAKAKALASTSSSWQAPPRSRPSERAAADNEWIVTSTVQEPSSTSSSDRRRQRLQQQIEMLTHELERLNEEEEHE